jgi:hypothetical protein
LNLCKLHEFSCEYLKKHILCILNTDIWTVEVLHELIIDIYSIQYTQNKQFFTEKNVSFGLINKLLILSIGFLLTNSLP